jgi:hypothetical protein
MRGKREYMNPVKGKVIKRETSILGIAGHVEEPRGLVMLLVAAMSLSEVKSATNKSWDLEESRLPHLFSIQIDTAIQCEYRPRHDLTITEMRRKGIQQLHLKDLFEVHVSS